MGRRPPSSYLAWVGALIVASAAPPDVRSPAVQGVPENPWPECFWEEWDPAASGVIFRLEPIADPYRHGQPIRIDPVLFNRSDRWIYVSECRGWARLEYDVHVFDGNGIEVRGKDREAEPLGCHAFSGSKLLPGAGRFGFDPIDLSAWYSLEPGKYLVVVDRKIGGPTVPSGLPAPYVLRAEVVIQVY